MQSQRFGAKKYNHCLLRFNLGIERVTYVFHIMFSEVFLPAHNTAPDSTMASCFRKWFDKHPHSDSLKTVICFDPVVPVL